MKRLRKVLPAALAVALGLGLAAPQAVAAQDGSPEMQYRKSLMQGLRMHMGAIRAVEGGAAPAGHAALHAAAFQGIATMLANAFPEGSAGEGSRALPAIWENRMDFMNKVSAIQSASAQLVAAADRGDSDAVGAAMTAVQGTCAGCHQPYRAR